MSFMTEKKAREKFQQYMSAEMQGRNAEADSLENELNNAGWFITNGPDGMTIKKKEKESSLPTVDDFLIPKESKITPYTPEKKSYKNLWIGLGITLGVIALTALTIYLVKRHQNAKITIPKSSYSLP